MAGDGALSTLGARDQKKIMFRDALRLERLEPLGRQAVQLGCDMQLVLKSATTKRVLRTCTLKGRLTPFPCSLGGGGT